MKRAVFLSLIVLPLLLATALSVTAEIIDDDPDAVALYTRGKRQMSEGSWLDAAATFQQLAGRFPESKNIDLFLFNRAKSEYHFGKYAEAIAGFEYLTSKYKQSEVVPAAHYFLGNAYYRNGELYSSLVSYFNAFEYVRHSRLRDQVVAAIKAVITNAEAVTLGRADFDSVTGNRRCDLIDIVAEALRDAGQGDEAAKISEYCGGAGSRTVTDRTPVDEDAWKVAFVLPFSGELAEYADEIYNGAVIASQLIEKKERIKLRPTSYDTKGDPVEAGRIVGKLADEPVDIAVGPLTSSEAMVSSAALSCTELPLLIPAATEAGLTALSDCSFQLSPNIELQGIVMAEYAVDKLGADSAAIITSTRTDHLRMARAFAERFTSLGGTLVATEYYRARDKDFGPHVRDIKGMIIGAEPDSTYFINAEGDTLNFDGVAAHVDCLFMPGTPSQLKLLLAQVNYYNLQAEYLGTDGWADEMIYKLDNSVTKYAIFPSPFLTVRSSKEYLEFATAFDSRYGKQPERLSRLGYDTMRLIAKAINQGARDRKSLIAQLASIKGFEGAAGTYTFGKNHENIDMPLFRIINNRAVPFVDNDSTAVGAAPEQP